MTKKIVGGYAWRQEIIRGRNANRAARHALRRIAEEDPGPRTLAMLLLKAANALGDCGGGQIVIKDGEIIGQVQLPIAGLMSNERAEIVAQNAATVLAGFQTCGCTLNNPNMQLSLLALVVIPELRISDLGLVDVTQFNFIPVVENNG